jgi:hypothetical protein
MLGGQGSELPVIQDREPPLQGDSSGLFLQRGSPHNLVRKNGPSLLPTRASHEARWVLLSAHPTRIVQKKGAGMHITTVGIDLASPQRVERVCQAKLPLDI